ncbi:hypothetical protein [Hydrogenophaga sp. NFH-34]|uniref:hypothetical protein n=1 Tax=Hydrogenophaga sp. NFH-34 TaxID=2744446 RepID=UPI001F2F202C|nr:hypothetical protein [Hydrogenophaga sp. NFH-34]
MNAEAARALARHAVRTPTLDAARTHVDSLIRQSAEVGLRKIVDPLASFDGPVSRSEEALLWQELREDHFEVVHDHHFPTFGPHHVNSVTAISW